MRRSMVFLAAMIAATQAVYARPLVADEDVAAARAMLGEAVGYPTVKGRGQVPAYAEALARTFRAAGFADSDIRIDRIGETATLTVRLPGRSRTAKPILLLGHMDVVEARAEDWERPPFTMVEEGGYLFGRGVADNKFDVTMMAKALLRLKAAGFRPSRDLILTLSGDEETDMLTTQELAKRFTHAELVLNGDGGGGTLAEDGRPLVYGLQAAEKTYADYRITITNPGGHSSRPSKINAIVQLAQVAQRIGAYSFAPQSSDLTRAYFRSMGARVGGDLGAAMLTYAANPSDLAAAERISEDPEFIGQVRTTCVPTMVDGGHALNALPQRAALSINCRIFPGVSIESVRDTLLAAAGEPAATIEILDKPVASDASPLRKDVMTAVRKAIDARFPGLTIQPQMSAGATDSLYFRRVGVPSYGTAGLFMKPSDDYAHGLNERVPVDAIPGALLHWDVLLRTLAK